MTSADVVRDAVDQMAMLRYFPTDTAVRMQIAKLLARICPHDAAVRFVASVMVDKIGEWRGPDTLRGIVSSRWRPADGLEASVPPEISSEGVSVAHAPIQLQGRPILAISGTVEDGQGEDQWLEAIRKAAEKRRVPSPTAADRAAAAEFMKRAGIMAQKELKP